MSKEKKRAKSESLHNDQFDGTDVFIIYKCVIIIS